MKTWAERIAEARKRGKSTAADFHDLSRFESCFLGEAMREVGRPMGEMAFLSKGFPSSLVDLSNGGDGGRERHPAVMMREGRWDDAESLRLAIRAKVAKLYGPSDESLIAATVAEAKEHAAEPELVEA